MKAFVDEILTVRFLEHLILFFIVALTLLIIWLILDAFGYFLKKRKRAKKNKDGGYLRWL